MIDIDIVEVVLNDGSMQFMPSSEWANVGKLNGWTKISVKSIDTKRITIEEYNKLVESGTGK